MLPEKWRPPIPFWQAFVAATLISLLFVIQEYIGFSYTNSEDSDFPWMFTTTGALSAFWLWALIWPLMYRLSRAFGPGVKLTVFKAAGQLLISIIVAFFHRVGSTLLLFVIYFVVEGAWYGQLNSHTYFSIFANILGSLIVYWILIGVFLAHDYYRSLRQKEVELIRMENELNNAQLRALKMQLHPHFLFNTLHTISSLMDESKEGAQKMLSQIGFLLRNLLEQDQKQKITLQEEMKYIRSYLDIEQTRFRDRLNIEYDVPEEVMSAEVPNLILQPLVENAIKHGFSRRTDCGKIIMTARRNGEFLEITVQDDGQGMDNPQQAIANGGIGLKNVQERLAQMYKEKATLKLASARGKGFSATISLPYQELTAAETANGKAG